MRTDETGQGEAEGLVLADMMAGLPPDLPRHVFLQRLAGRLYRLAAELLDRPRSPGDGERRSMDAQEVRRVELLLLADPPLTGDAIVRETGRHELTLIKALGRAGLDEATSRFERFDNLEDEAAARAAAASDGHLADLRRAYGDPSRSASLRPISPALEAARDNDHADRLGIGRAHDVTAAFFGDPGGERPPVEPTPPAVRGYRSVPITLAGRAG